MKMSEIWKQKAEELYQQEGKRYSATGTLNAVNVEKISLLHVAEDRCREYEDEKR